MLEEKKSFTNLNALMEKIKKYNKKLYKNESDGSKSSHNSNNYEKI